MIYLALVLAVLLTVAHTRAERFKRKLAQRDQRIALIEASWTTLAAKHERLKAERRQQELPARLPTNEQIERGVW